jgi:hypothetical protein
VSVAAIIWPMRKIEEARRIAGEETEEAEPKGRANDIFSPRSSDEVFQEASIRPAASRGIAARE